MATCLRVPMLAIERGQEITTIEGLGAPDG